MNSHRFASWFVFGLHLICSFSILWFALGGVAPVDASQGFLFAAEADRDGAADLQQDCAGWSLAADYRVYPGQQNPNPDSCGNLAVWHFLRSDSSRQTYTLLDAFENSIWGIIGLQGWGNTLPDQLPVVNINATGQDQQNGSSFWPAGAVRVHPSPDEFAVVGWRSPIEGLISISGGVDDLDDGGGDGVAWFVDRNSTNLASGAIDNGGTQSWRDGKGGYRLDALYVRLGDFLYFAVDPKGDHTYDATRLVIQIREVPGLLLWDDFRDGNAEGWTVTDDWNWRVENEEYVADPQGAISPGSSSFAGDSVWKDYIFDVDMKGETGVDKILRFRYQDELAQYGLNVRGDPLNDINLCVDPCLNLPFPNTNGTWVHLRVILEGQRILVFADGALLFDYTDASPAPYTHGKIGLGGWNWGKVRFDNVLVRKILAISGPTVGSVDADHTFLAAVSFITPTLPVTYTWQATGIPMVIHTGGITDTVQYQWSAPGTKTISLTAENQFETITDTYTVTIDTPVTGLLATSTSPTDLGEATTFTATVIGGSNVIYTWDFGDQITGAGAVVTHTYTLTGIYTATVTAHNAVSSLTASTNVAIWAKVYLPSLSR